MCLEVCVQARPGVTAQLVYFYFEQLTLLWHRIQVLEFETGPPCLHAGETRDTAQLV